jgi:cell division protein FtsN
MTTRAPLKIQFTFKAILISFVVGVVAALAAGAAMIMYINQTPVPFVNKVQQSTSSVDASLLDGKTIDPNKKLYASGQGVQQDASGVAPVISKNAAPATTERWWVNAGTFTENEEAEGMRARIAFIGLDSQITLDFTSGKRRYRVRVGPFDSKEQAQEIRQSLADNSISAQIFQQK